MKKYIHIIIFLLINIVAFGQAVNEFVNSPELKNASIGLYAENVKTGEVIVNYNANLSLVPASINKIIVTAIALELFGVNHKFKTEIAYSGKISNDGILTGNIYVIGGGDPCLNDEPLQQWANAVKNLGIKKINGNIIADISYFGEISIPNTWIWEDIANYYGNQGSALNYCNNQYFVHFSTGDTNGSDTKIIKTFPDNLGITFKNHVKSSSTGGDNAYIYNGSNDYEKIIRGTLPCKNSDYAIKGSMPNPELFLIKDFVSILNKNGIVLNGKQLLITESDSEPRKTIFTTLSPTLQEIINETNLKSNNLYAQVISYHIVKKSSKQYSDVVKENFNSKNIDISGLSLDDACGLSRFNTITAKQMTKFLIATSQNTEINKIFTESLPVAGVSGTLKSLNVGTKNKVIAKSGTMFRIRSYSGYIIDKNGNKIAFCFIVNNFNGSTNQIKLLFEKLFKEFD